MVKSKGQRTERRSAGEAVGADKVARAERERLKDEAALAQLVLALLDLLEPLFARGPGRRPQRDLVPSPPEVDAREGEALLVLVGARRRLTRGREDLHRRGVAGHEGSRAGDTASC